MPRPRICCGVASVRIPEHPQDLPWLACGHEHGHHYSMPWARTWFLRARGWNPELWSTASRSVTLSNPNSSSAAGVKGGWGRTAVITEGCLRAIASGNVASGRSTDIAWQKVDDLIEGHVLAATERDCTARELTRVQRLAQTSDLRS